MTELSTYDPERCPQCGKPMIRGIVWAGRPLLFEPGEKESRFIGGFREGSRKMGWKIRTYCCTSCKLYVSYEQDPKERATDEKKEN